MTAKAIEQVCIDRYKLKSERTLKIKKKIEVILDELRPTALISGMALGIDTLFAQIAIERNLELVAAIPCLGHPNKWPKTSQDIYYKILEYPKIKVQMVSNKPYDDKCMQNRNIWMVNNCDKLIAVWDGTTGGTKNCVDYAKAINKEIIRIIP